LNKLFKEIELQNCILTKYGFNDQSDNVNGLTFLWDIKSV